MRICRSCGTSFSSAHKDRPYCSQPCYWLSLRTERFPADPRERRAVEFSFLQKRLLLERAGGQCERCDAVEHLEFDHIKPCHLGGTNKLHNGQVLCRACHRRKTNAEIAARKS